MKSPLSKIKHCFCHHSPLNISKWIKRRYIDKIPTVELINNAESKNDIEVISLVGLIDVPENDLLTAMSDVDKETSHILGCRASAVKMLDKIRQDNH